MCQLVSVSRIEQAAAEALGCELEELTKESYQHYGLDIYSYGNVDIAIGDDDQANKAAYDNIQDNLWAFNTSFIIDHSKAKYSPELEKSLKEMQGKLCESANELVLDLIDDMDKFVSDAISSDGRGHFLSYYDGEEQEIYIEGTTFFYYRLQ